MPDLIVTWRSTAFNTAQPQPYFINPGCFGDDAARWLIARLHAMGIDADAAPDQEDFGWFFEFRIDNLAHCFVLSCRPEEDGSSTWIGAIEAGGGLLARIRNRGLIDRRALAAIHHALSGSVEVTDVRWHRRRDFDAGVEHGGATPDALAQLRASAPPRNR